MRTATREKRTWGQRLVILAITMAILSASGTGGVLAYFNHEVSGVTRVALEGVLSEPESEGSSSPINILLVGIDDPTGLPPDDPAWLEHSDTSNTDTMLILRIEPETLEVKLLSLPRDLWVDLHGTDRASEGRLNSAMELGGPDTLITTIQDELGMSVHHFVSVNFVSFMDVIGIVGGIPVEFPYASRSRMTGFLAPEPGCWVLGRRQALNFARARKDYQIQEADGDWRTDPRSDYSRVQRQQLLIQLALAAAISNGGRNPSRLSDLINAGIGAVQVDDRLVADEVVDIGRRFRDFAPSDIQHFTLPTTEAELASGAEVLFLDEPLAAPVLDEFVDHVEEFDPTGVQFIVQNGSGIEGQAAWVSTALAGKGLAVSVDETGTIETATTVYFPREQRGAALYLQSIIAGPTRLVEQGDATSSVRLVTGADWDGVVADGPSTDAPPTSSVPESTTTTTPAVSIPGADPTVDPFLPTAPRPDAPCRQLDE